MEIPDRADYKHPDARRFRVFLDGVERPNDVVEFCISEGWIKYHFRDATGKLKVERGKWVAIKKKGTVRVEWKDDRVGC